jgi:hypothetical protein
MGNGLTLGVVRELHVEFVEILRVGVAIAKVEDVTKGTILKSEVGVVANSGKWAEVPARFDFLTLVLCVCNKSTKGAE